MDKIALLFPGQGSQSVGMGKDLAYAFPEVRRVFQEADDILARDLTRLMFDGPWDELNRTQNAQPAIVAVGMAVTDVLEKRAGISSAVAFVAGHSLGEYPALHAAGSWSRSATMQYVQERARIMADALPPGFGTMAAFYGKGVELETIRWIAEKASLPGSECFVANDNSANQVVVSGHVAAIDRALAIAAAENLRAQKLNVTIPAHSPLMRHIEGDLHRTLARAPTEPPKLPWISNATAAVETDPAVIPALLTRQITSPVRWRESMQRMQAEGVGKFLECGPGSTLTNLAKRAAPNAAAISLGTAQAITAFLDLPPVAPASDMVENVRPRGVRRGAGESTVSRAP